MVKKLYEDSNITRHYFLLRPDWTREEYDVVDEANSVSEIKRMAYEWCDSDKFHIPVEYRHGHDIIYYGYCPETKKVYLPIWYTKADTEPFRFDWPIIGLEDFDN